MDSGWGFDWDDPSISQVEGGLATALLTTTRPIIFTAALV